MIFDAASGEILPEQGEQLIICKDTVYANRIVVFKTVADNVQQEIHLDSSSGRVIDREKRRAGFPKFEYSFAEQGLTAIVEHVFLDELQDLDYRPPGIDIETTTVRLLRGVREISLGKHLHPVNKFPPAHFEHAKSSVEWHVGMEESEIAFEAFLRDEFSTLNTDQKVRHLRYQIGFEDRMQGGYDSGYSSHIASYLSKWYMDTYGRYDRRPIRTLKRVARSFDVGTRYLKQMVRYDVDSAEWRSYASKIGLLTDADDSREQ